MSDIQSEEYKFLRQEHENNRKFIFERPLLIVGATFASAITINDKSLLLLLPLPFLALLYFNIWFTHNRMESSARIVSYLQIVHEGISKYKWIGWENAVRLYRKWIYDTHKNENELPCFNEQQFDSMAFYAPIFYFHLITGAATTIILILKSSLFCNLLAQKVTSQTTPLDWLFIIIDSIALVLFALLFIPFRPKTIRYQIEFKRCVWETKILEIKPIENNTNSNKVENLKLYP